MITLDKLVNRLRNMMVLNQVTIVIMIIVFLGILVLFIYIIQAQVEQNAFTSIPALNLSKQSDPVKNYEIAKLVAEIRQIQSDTMGSLFWLKLIALFVTVGGAVGGYLVGQSKATREKIASEDRRSKLRIDFEHRKDIDTTYQGI